MRPGTIARIAVSLGTVLWLAHRIDMGSLLKALKNFPPGYFLIAAVLFAVAQILSSRRWQVLAQALGVRAPYGLFLRYYFIGSYFNLIMPGAIGGDVIKAWLLARGQEGKLRISYSIVGDRGFGLGAILTLSLAGLMLRPELIPQMARWPLLMIIISGNLVFFAAPVLGPVIRRLVPGFPEDVFAFWHDRRAFVEAYLLSLAIQLLVIVFHWILGKGLKLPYGFDFYLLTVPIISVVTSLPFSVSGIGIREGGFAFFIQQLGGEPELGVALGILAFGVFLVVGGVGGLIYALREHERGKEALSVQKRCR